MLGYNYGPRTTGNTLSPHLSVNRSKLLILVHILTLHYVHMFFNVYHIKYRLPSENGYMQRTSRYRAQKSSFVWHILFHYVAHFLSAIYPTLTSICCIITSCNVRWNVHLRKQHLQTSGDISTIKDDKIILQRLEYIVESGWICL